MIYKFVIYGDAVPKARPKFTAWLCCRDCRKYYRPKKDEVAKCPVCSCRIFSIVGSAYTPKDTINQEKKVREAFASQFGGVIPTEGAVKLIVKTYLKPPKATPKYKMIEIEAGDVPVITSPDFDNYIKLVADALNKVVYVDDRKVFSGLSEKFYSIQPRQEVTIETEERLKPEEYFC